MQHQPVPSPSLLETDQINRSLLLSLFKTYWLRGSMDQTLQGLPALPLSLAVRHREPSHTDETTVALNTLPSCLATDELAGYVDLRKGPLLILGEAGAGKTILMLQIAQRLVERAQTDPVSPLPIYVQLGSWVPDLLPLHNWLCRELQRLYDVPIHTAERLLASQQIVLLLDGLDDIVNRESRSAGVKQINCLLQQSLVAGVVISGRSEVYHDLDQYLEGAQEVQLQPLSPAARDLLLSSSEQPHRALRAACASNPGLGELLLTPFWFSSALRAYTSQPDLQLKSALPKQLKSELLEVTINQAARRQRAPYKAEQMRKWLAMLAWAMEHSGLRAVRIEDLQPTWLRWWGLGLLQRAIVGTVAGIGFGLGGPLVGLLCFALTHRIRSRIAWLLLVMWGIAFSALLALPGGAPTTQPSVQLFSHLTPLALFTAVMAAVSALYTTIIGQRPTAQPDIKPAQYIGWDRSDAWRGAAIGIMCCLCLAGLFGSLIGFTISLFLAYFGVFLGALIAGRRVPIPGEQYTSHLRAVLAWALIAGLGVGLTAVFWALPQSSWPDSLVADQTRQLYVKLALSLVGMLAALGGWALLRRGKRGTTAQPAAPWSWQAGRQGGITGLLCGITLGTAAGAAAGSVSVLTRLLLAAGHSGGRITDTLTQSAAVLTLALAGLGIAIIAAAGTALAGVRIQRVPSALGPNTGIRRAGRRAAAILSGLGGVYAIGLALCLSLYSRVDRLFDFPDTPFLGLAVAFDQTVNSDGRGYAIAFVLLQALGLGLPLALLFGGYSWLNHMATRLILAASSAAPLNYPRFLDYAAERGLLRRAGGAYLFAHPTLQSYFAHLIRQQRTPTRVTPTPLRRHRRIATGLGIAGCVVALLVTLFTVGARVQQAAQPPAETTDQPVAADPLAKATLRLSGNGRYAAIGRVTPGEHIAYDSIGVIDMGSGQLIQILRAELFEIRTLAMSHDGAFVAASDGMKIVVWDSVSGIQVGMVDLDFDDIKVFTALALSPDASTLAYSASQPYNISLWDIRSGVVRKTLAGHTFLVDDMQFSATGEQLLSQDMLGNSRLWDVARGEALPASAQPPDMHDAAFSPDGGLVADRTEDNNIRIWRASDGALLQTLRNTLWIADLAWAPDNRHLAASVRDGLPGDEVLVWALADGTVSHRAVLQSSANIVVFSPDGKLIAAGDESGMIWLFDAELGSFLRTLRGHVAPLYEAAFAPDGQTLTTLGTDETVRRWLLNDGSAVHAVTWLGP